MIIKSFTNKNIFFPSQSKIFQLPFITPFFFLLSIVPSISFAEPVEPHQQQNSEQTDNIDRLISIAKEKGTVKVLVHLKIPGIEGLIISAAKMKNSEAIAKVDQVVALKIKEIGDLVIEGIKGTYYKINHRYSSIPLIALDVSMNALIILKSSKDVLSIKEDQPVPLNGS